MSFRNGVGGLEVHPVPIPYTVLHRTKPSIFREKMVGPKNIAVFFHKWRVRFFTSLIPVAGILRGLQNNLKKIQTGQESVLRRQEDRVLEKSPAILIQFQAHKKILRFFSNFWGVGDC